MLTIQLDTGSQPAKGKGDVMNAIRAAVVAPAIILIAAGIGLGVAQAGERDWNVEAMEAFYIAQPESQPVLTFEDEASSYGTGELAADDLRMGTPVETGSIPPSAGPAEFSQAKYRVAIANGEYDLVTSILDFPAGAAVPNHVHGGYAVVTVLDGEITLREKGAEKIVKAGESWTESPGNVHSAVNGGAVPARVAVSYLIPKGAEILTIVK